ncbi:hypothetical protein PS838_03049 [Pseudomonas fluorescens]|nr:hypothetical protein PS838_03049 [Pseudomonas fluorescens]
MNVLLLLYLCADASRTDCQVVPAQHWQGPDAYEQCVGTVPDLSNSLTAQNRQRHRFVCQVQVEVGRNAEHQALPALIHQSFRM